MAERRYGPTRGAGTVIVEKEGGKPIQPGALGVCVLIGVTEKGNVNELIPADSRQKFLNRCGDRVAYSLLPDAAFDFYDEGEGSGEIYVVRITDGNEVASELVLKNRRDPKASVMKVTAKNGGRWAGDRVEKFGAVTTIATDIAATEIETGLTLKENEFVGGYVQLLGVTTKTYKIVSNEADGTVVVESDSDMLGDLLGGADPTNKNFALILENEKYVAINISPNAVSPGDLFDFQIIENADLKLTIEGLSSDPNSDVYFVPMINDDGRNVWIDVEDLWGGGYAADIMPANYFGESTALTATQITLEILQASIVPAGATNPVPVVSTGAVGGKAVDDTLTLTFSDATNFGVVSAKFGANMYPAGVVATPVVGVNEFGITFTVGASTGDPYAAGDVITIEVNPLVVDELVGGEIFPDWENDNRTSFPISANTGNTVSVSIGYDMTAGGTITAPTKALLSWNEQLAGGYDGLADLDDADYIAKMAPTTTVIRQLLVKNKGLVKIAVPGVTSTSVQKAAAALAEALNYQFRVEIPHTIVDEDAAADYINNTIGRNDFMVGAFPSYGYIQNPVVAGKKLVSLTGEIFGEEAKFARNYNGYHKAAAGEDAVLSKVLEIPTGDRIINEEKLNPLGMQVIKKLSGNFVIWGDRTLATSGGQSWKHKRELLSYYEHVLQESFNWIIFALNDPLTRDDAKTALRSFFEPEWRKRALQGTDFEQACAIKIDEENNPPSETAAGNMHAEVKLWFADTVERFIITVSERGIFEAAA